MWENAYTCLCIETRYTGVTPLGYIWGFHKRTKLAILALLPTLYSQISAIYFLTRNI